jgi:hypothetical protein
LVPAQTMGRKRKMRRLALRHLEIEVGWTGLDKGSIREANAEKAKDGTKINERLNGDIDRKPDIAMGKM